MRAAVLGIVVAGCGSAPPPCAHTAGGRPAREVTHGDFDVAYVPSFEAAWLANDSDQERQVVLGAVRMTVRDGEVLLADDVFAEEIETVFACGGGWGFRARDGAIASAETFTGPLERRDAAFLQTCEERPGARLPPDLDPEETLLARRPWWRVAHVDAFFPFAGGLLVGDGDEWEVRSEDDGALVATLPAELSDCSPDRWGDRLAMTCDDGDGKKLSWSRDGRTFERVPLPRGVRPFFFSDDGVHAWSLDECPEPGGETVHHYCAYDGRAWRDVRLPAGWFHDFHGMHGPYVWGDVTPFEIAGVRETRATGLTRPFLVDVRTSARCDVRFGSVPRLDCDVGELRFAPDGAIYGPIRCRDGRRWARGRPDQGLTAFELPRGATDVRFVDARRAIAVGAVASEIWRTTDFGTTWTPIDLGLGGDASKISLGTKIRGGDPYSTKLLDCWESRCLVGDRILVQGWEGSRAPPGRVLAAQ